MPVGCALSILLAVLVFRKDLALHIYNTCLGEVYRVIEWQEAIDVCSVHRDNTPFLL